MSQTHTTLKSTLRIGAAVILTGLAILLLVISGPLRAGWGFIGNADNAGNTVISLMKVPSVQSAVTIQLETDFKKSSSVAVAQLITLHAKEINGAVISLLNNPLVQQLVAADVRSAYTAVETQKDTSINFVPLVNQVTASIHKIDPRVPITLPTTNKMVVNFHRGEVVFSGLNRLGTGSVALWLVALVMILGAVFGLMRSRRGRYLVAGIGFVVPALLLIVMSKVVHSIVMGSKFKDELTSAATDVLSMRFGSSLVHTAILELLTGCLVAAAIFGVDRWWPKKSTAMVEAAN